MLHRREVQDHAWAAPPDSDDAMPVDQDDAPYPMFAEKAGAAATLGAAIPMTTLEMTRCEYVSNLMRALMDAINVGHYTGDHAAKWSEQVAALCPALAHGIDDLRKVQPERKDFARDPSDPYEHMRLGTGVPRGRPTGATAEEIDVGRLTFVRLQNSSHKCLLKKATECALQQIYKHEAYCAHKDWT